MRQQIYSIATASLLAVVLAATGCGGEEKDAATPKADAPVTPAVSQTQIVNGRNTFLRTCAACHGTDAKGMPNNGKDLTASEFVKSQTDEQLLQYVIQGREVPGGVSMPPRGGFPEDQLTDDQIRDVIAYLRRFPGNRP
ncbi:MAG: cytochrome c [Planctomycetota bacterium]|nr:MAG: cytochrome c [Planctomycetota bacterium]